MPETEEVQNVQTSLLPLAEAGLKKDVYNIIQHDKRNLDAIDASVDEVGFGRSIVTDAETDTVLVGNGTYETALKKNAKALFVDVKDPNTIVVVRRHGLTETQKRRMALWDNRTSDLHKYDKQAVARLNEAHPEQQLLSGVFSEREQEKMLRMHADAQPLAPGGTEDENPESTAVAMRPESGIRLVSIFCTQDTQPLFIRKVRALSALLGKTTITDTVLAIVDKAFDEWIPKEESQEDGNNPVTSNAT